MATLTCNGRETTITTAASLTDAIEQVQSIPQIEVWLSMSNEGPYLCLLRNHDHAVLLYLADSDDAGSVSGIAGEDDDTAPTISYRLPDGQHEDYPQSWCVPLPHCWQALTDFLTQGLKKSAPVLDPPDDV